MGLRNFTFLNNFKGKYLNVLDYNINRLIMKNKKSEVTKEERFMNQLN